MKMSSFLDKLNNPVDDEIYYIQQQNSNFENYFHELWRDIDSLPWAGELFGKNPDAINFWMGDKRAITSSNYFYILFYLFFQKILNVRIFTTLKYDLSLILSMYEFK